MAGARGRLERLTARGDDRITQGAGAEDRARRRLFAAIFGAVVAVGLVYTLLQPVRYRSSATVLMSAPAAIDAPAAVADAQKVAIQRRILLGQEITDAMAQALGARGVARGEATLRGMLSVEPVPETNLVELAATGNDAALLPQVVSSWIDVYLDIRARDISERRSSTIARVEEELSALDRRTREARDALASFRADNDIVSVEREQNAVMSRLDGLNAALREAEAEEVRAKVYLDTVRSAIERDKLVLPEARRGELDAMERELETLRTELTVLRKRFTPEYIERDATLRQIPRRVARLEQDIARLLDRGSQLELANAQRAYGAARAAVRELEGRLASHREAVTAFTRTYERHAALRDDLARLEELKREAQARLVQMEVRREDKYPQVSVVEAPTAESTRIGPNYGLLAGATLAAALLAAIGGVWLRGFLSPSSRQARPAYFTVSGVHFPAPQSAGDLAYENAPGLQRDEQERLGRRDDDA